VSGFITAGEGYADYYMQRYSDILKSRPIVIENMPRDIVKPKATRRPVKLLFMGNLGRARPIYELIQAMALTKSDASLTFIGPNSLELEPQTLIEALGLADRVRLLAPCGPEDVTAIAADYDIGVVALRGDNENERHATPAKLGTYMAAGLAIIASDLPGSARVIREAANGVLVDHMDPHSWANAIDRCAAMTDGQIDYMRNNSHRAALARSRETQMTEFIREFERAIFCQSWLGG
jgi:glycosyltransferase involved in cell wall biosynthesis